MALGAASTTDNVRILCDLCRERHNRHYSASDLMPRASSESLNAWWFSARDAA
ncbi:MAG TPA: hypothetical protein VEM76_18035 [Anaeromyxobacteraceae bacterium]|nr:hypothetical protein [Anaeromyxobacteraceae bacterium]